MMYDFAEVPLPEYDGAGEEGYFRAGKAFEQVFADAFRAATGRYLERLVDNKNMQPCDFFAILQETPEHAGVSLFLELKWTGRTEFSLQNAAPHQLQAMRFLDKATAASRAGFVIFFGRSGRAYYISGTAMHRYCSQEPRRETVSESFLRSNGIRIGFHDKRFDIAGFLQELCPKACSV